MNIMPLEYSIATTHDERGEVFRLRYSCYRRNGSIAGRADERFSDGYDQMPNSFSILVKTAGQTVATVRISVMRPDLGWIHSPVQHVYGDHEAFQAIERESFVEASRLCFHEQARRDTFVGLVGHMAALAKFYDAAWLVACPRVEHAQSYQRLFGFRPLAAPRQYFGVSFETQLLAIRREEILAFVDHRKPMKSAWTKALEGLKRTAELASPRLHGVNAFEPDACAHPRS